MKNIATSRRLLTSLLITLALTIPSATFANDVAAALQCLKAETLKVLTESHPKSLRMATALEGFAKEHGLPIQVVSVGPPERRVERMIVGLDATKPELVDAYLKRFHLEGSVDEQVKGTLALEFQNEHDHVGSYVTGVLRPSSDPAAEIYRWGRPDLKRNDWWNEWVIGGGRGRPDQPILAFSHLFPLDEGELTNVKHFLKHSDQNLRSPEVAACKSTNCVAWTASIELGTSKPGATDEERRFLFSELGMARSMAHFEIARRLIHASNEKHVAMIAFLNGEKGAEAFKNVANYFPPDPKIPYSQIIKDTIFQAKDQMDAVSVIPDGGKVFIPLAAGASPEGVAALMEYASNLKTGLDVHLLVNGVSEKALREGLEKANSKLRLHALFLGGNLRKLSREGKVNVIPGYLGDFTKWMRNPRNTRFHYDAIIVRVAPADEAGRYSLGPNHDMIMSVIQARPQIKVIAEINPNIPRTTGDNFLREDQITKRFNSTSQLAGPPVTPLTEVEEKIGENVAQLIDEGATIQVGIGNLFGGLPRGLEKRGMKGLKIHTEMFGDALKELIDKGIADNAETGFAYGSDNLYKWLDRNPKVVFRETEYVNSPAKVSEKPKFHAVNTALQVNLRGDVNATFGMDGHRMSSPGGQVEFMSGAAKSEGGKAIIAIRSTAKDGTISSISLDLYGQSVTTPGEMVTHVVTEFGVAELIGKGERERAVALINVAHPKFRQQLIDEGLRRQILLEDDKAQVLLAP